MSVLVLVEVQTKSPQELKAFFQAELSATREYDGCEGLTVHTNMDDSNNVVVAERWESRVHYEKYLAWREERGDLDSLGPLLDGPPSIRYFATMSV